MSRKRTRVMIAVCIMVGIGWGLCSVFLLGNCFVASQDPADYPEDWDYVCDLMPPGEYSALGKSVFFPGWASAQLTTVDGVIYYAGPNTDMYNPFLYLCSIGIGSMLLLLVAFISRLVYLSVRKMRGTS